MGGVPQSILSSGWHVNNVGLMERVLLERRQILNRRPLMNEMGVGQNLQLYLSAEWIILSSLYTIHYRMDAQSKFSNED